jgi:hypothetical protein
MPMKQWILIIILHKWISIENPRIGEFSIRVLEQAQRDSVARFCKIWQEFLWWRNFGGHFAWIALKIESSRPPCSKALDLLHWAICAVLYPCTATAIKTTSFVGEFVDCCLFTCCFGGRWGNMEQVVARWRLPVASRLALDMPHWAMPSVLLQRTTVAIKTAGGWGTFAHCRLLFP